MPTDNVARPIPNGTKFKSKDTGANGHLMGHTLYDEAEAEVLGKVTASPTANTVLGRLKDISTPLTNFGAGEYETVAASATDQAMGATGASGDYLAAVIIVPGTAAAGAVSIKDGAGSAISLFAGGGTTALPTLAPIRVDLGMISLSGAWKITTGTNVTAIGIGNFT